MKSEGYERREFRGVKTEVGSKKNDEANSGFVILSEILQRFLVQEFEDFGWIRDHGCEFDGDLIVDLVSQLRYFEDSLIGDLLASEAGFFEIMLRVSFECLCLSAAEEAFKGAATAVIEVETGGWVSDVEFDLRIIDFSRATIQDLKKN